MQPPDAQSASGAVEQAAVPFVRPARAERLSDVVIVGAGLGGTIAAVVLGRAGFRVILIDRHEVYPPDFRAEQLVGDQVAMLRRLGVLEGIVAGASRANYALGVRGGRVIDREDSVHYALRYEAMVNAARAQLPASVRFIGGSVSEIEAGPAFQRVRLSSGEAVGARLVVLATGPANALSRKLGIERCVVRTDHSLTIGFDILGTHGDAFAAPVFVYHGESVRSRIDYLTIFPFGQRSRANLFAYRDLQDPWTRAFRRNPRETLLASMPGLERFLGAFRLASQVQIRTNHLYHARNYLRDGVVLIGDAFQTSCPAAGTGVGRVLTDVERLCTVHLPQWLATPGMGIEKIRQFYADPVKRACDAEATHRAEYRRAVSIETSLLWCARRLNRHLRENLHGWMVGASNVRTGTSRFMSMTEPAGSAPAIGLGEGDQNDTPAAPRGRAFAGGESGPEAPGV